MQTLPWDGLSSDRRHAGRDRLHFPSGWTAATSTSRVSLSPTSIFYVPTLKHQREGVWRRVAVNANTRWARVNAKAKPLKGSRSNLARSG